MRGERCFVSRVSLRMSSVGSGKFQVHFFFWNPASMSSLSLKVWVLGNPAHYSSEELLCQTSHVWKFENLPAIGLSFFWMPVSPCLFQSWKFETGKPVCFKSPFLGAAAQSLTFFPYISHAWTCSLWFHPFSFLNKPHEAQARKSEGKWFRFTFKTVKPPFLPFSSENFGQWDEPKLHVHVIVNKLTLCWRS